MANENPTGRDDLHLFPESPAGALVGWWCPACSAYHSPFASTCPAALASPATAWPSPIPYGTGTPWPPASPTITFVGSEMAPAVHDVG